mgnify:CR=1 FL=1
MAWSRPCDARQSNEYRPPATTTPTITTIQINHWTRANVSPHVAQLSDSPSAFQHFRQVPLARFFAVANMSVGCVCMSNSLAALAPRQSGGDGSKSMDPMYREFCPFDQTLNDDDYRQNC